MKVFGIKRCFESSLKNIKVITIEYLLTKDNLNASKLQFENVTHDVTYNTKQINNSL